MNLESHKETIKYDCDSCRNLAQRAEIFEGLLDYWQDRCLELTGVIDGLRQKIQDMKSDGNLS